MRLDSESEQRVDGATLLRLFFCFFCFCSAQTLNHVTTAMVGAEADIRHIAPVRLFVLLCDGPRNFRAALTSGQLHPVLSKTILT